MQVYNFEPTLLTNILSKPNEMLEATPGHNGSAASHPVSKRKWVLLEYCCWPLDFILLMRNIQVEIYT